MTTTITADFVLAGGQQITGASEDALVIDGPDWRTVSLDGVVSVTATTNIYPVFGVRAFSSGPPQVLHALTIGATGAVVVVSTAPQNYAGGIVASGSGNRVQVVNLGLISVKTDGEALGVGAGDGGFDNRGSVTVEASNGAVAVTVDGGPFTNSGTISVISGGQMFNGVTGVRLQQDSLADPFINTGTIRASAISPAVVSVGAQFSGFVTLTNSGLIEADRALFFVRDGIVSDGGRTARVTNTGTLRGEVFLDNETGEPVVLRNAGTIEGAVMLNNGADTYNGVGGSVSGVVHGDTGADSIVGGSGAETLAGDAGNDTIDGGAGGADVLDGGDGVDLLSFAASAVAVTLDVGAATGPAGVQWSRFEQYLGSQRDDTIRGSLTGDTLGGGDGADTVGGGAGDDRIDGGAGTNYLRGDEGNDSIVGGSGFDDINGNMGNDTCVSGGGDDWVVGGKDNDSLTGSAGQNLVYGNLGADTCEGGGGNDIVRGGQDNDQVSGGDGNDFVSGDKGSDTVTGGAGADLFHTFGDAGLDRVTDFSLAQGDRVQLDPGTQFTVSQVGADTVIDMTGGGQMILVGVTMSTLTPGWIFGA